MSDVFRRSAQILRADGWRPTYLAASAAILLLLAWIWWFFDARVTVYAQSQRARLESNGAVHVVDATAQGKVRAVHAALGQAVRFGDVLIELDTTRETLQQHEDEARVQSKGALVDEFSRQAALEQDELQETRNSASATAREAMNRYMEADELARASIEELSRGEELFRRGILPAADRNRLTSDAKRKRAAADALKQAADHATSEATLATAAKEATLAKTRGDLAAAEADLHASAIAVQASATDVDRGIIRAPLAGHIAEMLDLHVGSVVKVGDRLTSVVPDGQVAIAADYDPAVAIGRIRPGQHARFTVDAFPLLEYGAIEATVRRVAVEPKNGTVRVVLQVSRAPRGIPLQHGLTGMVEVETERMSPASLLLRSAGYAER